MSSALKLTVTSPPQSFSEPLTVAEVEHFLGLVSLSPDDAERTALLEGLIIAAREMAETFQNRDLILKQWDLTLPYFPMTRPPYPVMAHRTNQWHYHLLHSDTCAIRLRDPLVSVDLVTCKDSDGVTHTLTEGADYIVDTSKQPGEIMPPFGKVWPPYTPWPSSSVLVRFTSGFNPADVFWSDAGQRVLIGLKMLVSDWFQVRLPRTLKVEDLGDAVSYLLSSGAVSRQS